MWRIIWRGIKEGRWGVEWSHIDSADKHLTVARELAPAGLRSGPKLSKLGQSDRTRNLLGDSQRQLSTQAKHPTLWRGGLPPLGCEAALKPASAEHQTNTNCAAEDLSAKQKIRCL